MSKDVSEEIEANPKLKANIRVLFSYNLTDMPSSKKVRFVYLMKGRNKEKGIVESFDGEYISSSSFIIPSVKDEEIREIFALWGVQYTRKRLLLID